MPITEQDVVRFRMRTALAINDLAEEIFDKTREAGWWDEAQRVNPNADSSVPDRYLIPTKIALMHSELSEALEGFRKGQMDDHLPHRQMIEVELADAIIRILDTAGYLELDVGGALMEKLAYNATRPDHSREARAAEGGKSV